MRGHKARLLSYFEQYGNITSKEAFEKLGMTRLSAVVFDLRKLGYRIDTVTVESSNRYGEPVRFARYVYRKEKENVK